MNETVNVAVQGGTPGSDSNDYILFASTTCFSNSTLRAHDINRITFTVVNDHTGTLKAYYSQDKGTTWTQYDSQAVGIPVSGKVSGPFDYLVDPFPDWKLVWTNGGTAQATWLPALVLIRGLRASGV